MSDTAPCLQRNTGDSPVDVPDIPATVGPGDTVAWHLPIAGFEPVPADDPTPSKRKAAAPAVPAPSGEEPTA